MKKKFILWIPIGSISIPIPITVTEKDVLSKKKVPLTSDQLRTAAEVLTWMADVKDGLTLNP